MTSSDLPKTLDQKIAFIRERISYLTKFAVEKHIPRPNVCSCCGNDIESPLQLTEETAARLPANLLKAKLCFYCLEEKLGPLKLSDFVPCIRNESLFIGAILMQRGE